MLVSASSLGGHMDTFTSVELSARRTRRRHAASFKASIVAACRQPSMSLSAVSLANGLNPNNPESYTRDQAWMVSQGRLSKSPRSLVWVALCSPDGRRVQQLSDAPAVRRRAFGPVANTNAWRD